MAAASLTSRHWQLKRFLWAALYQSRLPEARASWTEAWDEGSVLHELWEDGAA
jgi:hypothetical protein